MRHDKSNYIMISVGNGTESKPIKCDFGTESEVVKVASDYLESLPAFEVLPKKTAAKNEGVITMQFQDEKIYIKGLDEIDVGVNEKYAEVETPINNEWKEIFKNWPAVMKRIDNFYNFQSKKKKTI